MATTAAAAPEEDEDQIPWGIRSWEILEKVRNSRPLIQCITNFVSMDLAANVLLAAGASPAMIHTVEEMADFTPHIAALYVNIGTLSPQWLAGMKEAIGIAVELGKPWVLDPVAVSASEFRFEACLELLRLRPSVIRGNASEILALGLGRTSAGPNKGVDSNDSVTDAKEAAKVLAQTYGSIAAVTGVKDIATDGEHLLVASNGEAMLQCITATGCAVSALVAAFVAVSPPDTKLEATIAALSVFGVASELGKEKAGGPGSLRMHLIDSLYSIRMSTLIERTLIEHESA